VRHDARRHRKPEGLGLFVELAEQRACLHPCRSLLRIHSDALHGLQVDHQRVVGNRKARERVPTASDRDRQAGRTTELHRGDYVRDARAADDHRRSLVEAAVPDLAVHVVARLSGTNDLSTECSLVDLDRVDDGRHRPSLSRRARERQVFAPTSPRSRRRQGS
jgi:hypothetical protein